MRLKLDMTSETPIYQQIRNEIVLGIAGGQLKEGEELPTVRQMAEAVGVNPMTVNKAYGVLKEEGFIVIDRRKGAKVKALGGAERIFDEDFDRRWRLLMSEARVRGATVSQLRDRFEELARGIFQGDTSEGGEG